MIILLSPAKSLNFEPTKIKKHSTPRLLEESNVLVGQLKTKSANSIKKLMSVSDNIAKLNVDRFNNFKTPFTLDNAKQAILAFDGDVYLGLEADTFDSKDMTFAQKHIRILSGLYGVLKPLDLMQPYRLEMGTRLKVKRKKNLYDFWDEKITEMINEDLTNSKSDIILNLASKEYFGSVKPKLANGKIVHVHFKELRNGQYKVISFTAKKARGKMANLIVKNRITDLKSLFKLNVDGYQYNKELSDESNLFFGKE